ncbi:hypothetical protein HMPREF9061_00002 [Actinomyces sp. oral taxon 181 str. F0379]|nr:hypothetical protein HMPREF9061_00002 [Actinomyces sp. oral taxon 181 str. F0379]
MRHFREYSDEAQTCARQHGSLKNYEARRPSRRGRGKHSCQEDA